jgi:hypothetical protein
LHVFLNEKLPNSRLSPQLRPTPNAPTITHGFGLEFVRH